MYKVLYNILVLEAIRRTGNDASSSSWEPLKDYIIDLKSSDLLSIDSKITDEGKKTLLLLDDDRRDFLNEWDKYKAFNNGNVTYDARLSVFTFKIRKSPIKQDLLDDFCIRVIWDDFFDLIQLLNTKGQNWQSSFFYMWNQYVATQQGLDAWKLLGRTREEAERVGTLLTNPGKHTDLVQITKI